MVLIYSRKLYGHNNENHSHLVRINPHAMNQKRFRLTPLAFAATSSRDYRNGVLLLLLYVFHSRFVTSSNTISNVAFWLSHYPRCTWVSKVDLFFVA